MTLKLSTLSPPLCTVPALVLTLLLSACGNKGDLFLVSDEITEQDLLRLEQVLEAETSSINGVSIDEKDKDKLKQDKIKNDPSS